MTFFFITLFMIIVFWRPQEWLLPWLYGWNILNVIFIFAMISFLVEVREGRLRIPRNSPQVVLIPGLWAGVLMSHIAHTYLEGLMNSWFISFKYVIFTFILYCTINSYKRLRTIALIFVSMTSLMAVHALMQQKLGYGFGGLRPILGGNYKGEIVVRSVFYGIFEDPNDLAHILATAMPFCFVITKRKSFLGFLIGAGLNYLLVMGILATNSRGGLVGAAAAIGVMFIMILPARWTPRMLALMIIGGLMMTTLAGSFLDDSAHDRVAFWGEANEAFKHTPLFGVGYGMLIEYIQQDRAVHNAFVLCYSELGLFGYWFWFGLMLTGVMGAWRVRDALRRVRDRDGAWVRRFSGMGIASMTGYAASAYFLQRAYVYPIFFLFATLGAIPVVAKKYLPEDHAPIFNLRRDLGLYNTAASVASIFYIYISILILNKVW